MTIRTCGTPFSITKGLLRLGGSCLPSPSLSQKTLPITVPKSKSTSGISLTVSLATLDIVVPLTSWANAMFLCLPKTTPAPTIN